MEASLPSVSLLKEIHYLFTTSKYLVCVLITRTSISPSGVAFQTAVREIITSDLIGRPRGFKDSDSAVNSWTAIGTHQYSGKYGQNFRRDVHYHPWLVTSTKDRVTGNMGSSGAPAGLVAYGLLALQALYMFCMASDIEEEFLLIQGRFVFMAIAPEITLFPLLIFDFTIRS